MYLAKLADHLRRHRGFYGLIVFGLLFSFASYRLYFNYISSELTKRLFADFYLVSMSAGLTATAFVFIRQTRIKSYHIRIYRLAKFAALIFTAALMAVALFITSLVKTQVIAFFFYVVRRLASSLSLLTPLGEAQASVLFLGFIFSLRSDIGAFIIGSIWCLLLVVTLIILLIRAFCSVRDSDSLKIVSSPSLTCPDINPVHKRGKNLALGLLYKPLP